MAPVHVQNSQILVYTLFENTENTHSAKNHSKNDVQNWIQFFGAREISHASREPEITGTSREQR